MEQSTPSILTSHQGEADQCDLDSFVWSTHRVLDGESVAVAQWSERTNSIERTDEVTFRVRTWSGSYAIQCKSIRGQMSPSSTGRRTI